MSELCKKIKNKNHGIRKPYESDDTENDQSDNEEQRETICVYSIKDNNLKEAKAVLKQIDSTNWTHIRKD